LGRGRHVISCNKGPLAFAFREIRKSADENGVAFLHETTVMDGSPVFDMARNCMRGNTILRIDGILNSTSNYVLCAMEKGQSFAEGVAGAQAEQIAEADPSNDLDGWDASVKIVALANVLMGADLKPEDVDRESMAGITPERVKTARERGNRIKMVCSAWRENNAVKASVKASEVPLEHPFALVDATGSIVRFETDLLGKILMTEENPDITTTAYGVITDLYALDAGSR
jgi:homoserine dehydrogenase